MTIRSLGFADNKCPIRGEEFDETWEHFVSDEAVYFCESVSGKRELGSGGLVRLDNYQRGRQWFDLHVTLQADRKRYFRVTISGCHNLAHIDRSRRPRSLDIDQCVTDSDCGVLVEIAKLIQLPKGMRLRGLPSHIRLKLLDDTDGITGEIPCRVDESLPVNIAVSRLNRETALIAGALTTQERELPYKLVQRGAERISELANNDGDVAVPWFEFHAYDVKALFRIVFFSDGVGIVCLKSGPFVINKLEMFTRPAGFHTRIEQA